MLGSESINFAMVFLPLSNSVICPITPSYNNNTTILQQYQILLYIRYLPLLNFCLMNKMLSKYISGFHILEKLPHNAK